MFSSYQEQQAKGLWALTSHYKDNTQNVQLLQNKIWISCRKVYWFCTVTLFNTLVNKSLDPGLAHTETNIPKICYINSIKIHLQCTVESPLVLTCLKTCQLTLKQTAVKYFDVVKILCPDKLSGRNNVTQKLAKKCVYKCKVFSGNICIHR